MNLRGEFNVPIGTKDTVLLDTDDFCGTAKVLKSAELHVADFEKMLDQTESGDFAFVDPPYITAHNFNGFVKYNEKLFGWNDQIRLRDAIARASRRGVKILMTNADHSSVRTLYSGMGKFVGLERASVIAGSSDHRNLTTELLFKTYS